MKHTPITAAPARKFTVDDVLRGVTCPQAHGPQDISYLGGPIPVRTHPPLFDGLGSRGSVIPDGWSDADFGRVFG